MTCPVIHRASSVARKAISRAASSGSPQRPIGICASAVGKSSDVGVQIGLPIIAVPTTFAGSEATDVWGVTENGRKRTGNDPRVLPAVVVYDADPRGDLDTLQSPQRTVLRGRVVA